MTERFKKATQNTSWWDIGYRGFMVIGMIAVMYLNLHYVPRDEFQKFMEQDNSRYESLKDVVIEMKSTNTILTGLSERIADHEIRIRSLESRPLR